MFCIISNYRTRTDKFSNNIYKLKLIRRDTLKYPTLSSLAFAIYISKFLKDYQIPLINGAIYELIKKAYTGGNVNPLLMEIKYIDMRLTHYILML